MIPKKKMTPKELWTNLVTHTLARILWSIIVSGYIWLVAWIFDPSINSGDIWLVGVSVGLITYQMKVEPVA